MATANDSPANFSTASLISAMQRLMLDPDLADLTVTCGDREWKVHSVLLAVRSPFFKAAVTTNMMEKLEMKVDVKEFDPNAMDEVINFMYGIPKENAPAQFLFEAAERFQMKDLKEYAVKIAKKEMSVENVVEFGHIAEMFSIEDLLTDCATFIAKNDVSLSGEDTPPKLAVMVVRILKDANRNLKGIVYQFYKLGLNEAFCHSDSENLSHSVVSCSKLLKKAKTVTFANAPIRTPK